MSHYKTRAGSIMQAQITATVVVALISGTVAIQTLPQTDARDPLVQKAWVNAMAGAAMDASLEDIMNGGTGALTGDYSGSHTWYSEISDFGDAIQIIATAKDGKIVSTSEAILMKEMLPIPAALYQELPLAGVSEFGSSINVIGDNVNWDGTPGSKAGLPAVLGMPAGDIEDDHWLENGMYDLRERIDTYGNLASNKLQGGEHTGNWGSKERSSFKITSVAGDMRQVDFGSGAGILVVNGDLRIGGVFNWCGAVLVGGNLVLEPNCAIYVQGCVQLEGSIIPLLTTSEQSVGTCDIEYSQELRAAIASLVTYQVVDRIQPR